MGNQIMNMKKPTAVALTVCVVLCMSACGKSAGETPDTDTSENSVENEGQEIAAPTDNTGQAAEDEGKESDMGSSISIDMKTEDTITLTTDDGTVYYTITCSYPVVSIAGNEAAAAKINADISSQVASYHSAVDSIAESAKEDFEYLLNDDDYDYTPFPYDSDLSYTVTRSDNHVISFTGNYYEYMGGAHGLPATIGINYDTSTGELLTFTDLSDDPDAFRAATLAYNQELAQTGYYSMQMFSQEDITNGTLEDVLYSDGSWYLSTSGLVFMSPPYALAPYAAGTLEFTIPYSELADMGFRDAYAYTDRQIVKLVENNPYSTDINGDGNKDSITYYNEWVYDDDSYGVLTHLTVNDLDFVQDGTDDVREKLTSSVGPQLSVYDLDIDDNYVELAAIFVEWTQNDGDTEPTATQYSRFFRYMEDGSLIYLGQTDGDVTDPTVSFTELEHDTE